MYFKRGNGKYGNRKREESGKEGPFKKTLVNTGRPRKKTVDTAANATAGVRQ